jgi:hypothetical protein
MNHVIEIHTHSCELCLGPVEQHLGLRDNLASIAS